MQIIDSTVEMISEVDTAVASGAAGGERSLYVQFQCDYEATRPDCWGEIPACLETMGFKLEREPDGSVELFYPITFFSANAVIGARKIYAGDSDWMVERDLLELRALLNGSWYRVGRDNSFARRQHTRCSRT